jgi:carboxyl-terminal processing protease
LKSVNYFGTLPDTDIGYVRLSRFAEETSRELRHAVTSLNEDGVSSIIFDLRSNGGGLLDQAKEVSELFLDSAREIVYTKGRDTYPERHYFSQALPLFGDDKPVVVLVDEGTASASEIVAGALQDWDRGLVVGSTTYGKGLVQGIFDLPGGDHIKLTTAKYYVPSGRCIQKPDRQAKRSTHANRLDASEEDTLVVIDDPEIFYTNGGRIVYGGGGITPDVEVERDRWQPIEINLERKSMFFDFAIEYVAAHPDIKPDFQVTDELIDDFRAFTKKADFSYKSALQIAVEDLETTINEEDKEALFEQSIAEMDEVVTAEKEADFDRSVPYIKRAIKREIVSAVFGERGVYEHLIFETDKTLLKAKEILQKQGEYTRLMSNGKRKAEL